MTKEYRVLLVEDSPEQAEMVQDYLKLTGGFAIEWAPDIRSFWSILSLKPFDIILMDYRLPDGNGLATLMEFGRRGYKLPIVMVTGQGDERIAAQAIQHGAAEYVVKKPDYFMTLPKVIQKVVKDYDLQKRIVSSLEKIRYQALLLNNVRDAVVVWDVNGHITFWNQAAEALFGWTSKERVGMDVRAAYFTSFSPPLDPGKINVNGELESERQVISKRQDNFWISSKITTLRDNGLDGRLIGFMDVSRDISERRRMEAEIETAMTHLTESARLAAIGELASGVAHRIYNPLTSIIANAQILKHNNSDQRVMFESVEDIEKAGWKAQEVVRQLLDFSRPSSNSMGAISIEETIRKALGLVGVQIEANGVQLVLSFHKSLPSIYGNPRQIEDLWVNLLLLARDATSDGKPHSISIKTELVSREILVEIYDDGNPIPEEQLVYVFEPDFIGGSIGRGTGLELSICREIIRQQKGRISVKSTHEGTTFFVYFPVKMAEPRV